MATVFPASDWVDELWAALRDDEAFRRAAATWVHGPMLWTVRPSENSGLDAPVVLRLDVHEGEARELRVESSASVPAPTTFSGTYATWKNILSGSTTVLDAVLGGQLSFDGDLPQVKLHGRMFDALVAASAGIGTTFADEAAAETVSR